jgi:adenylate cyclase
MESRTRLRVALFLAVGMTTTGLALLAYGSHLIAPGSGWDVFGGAELSSIDRRFAIRGQEKPPKNIVVVKIDDTTFSELGKRWPFTRTVHAQAIKNLKAAGAKVIAYDIQFSEPTEGQKGIIQDNTFMDENRAAGNLVFSTTEVNDKGEGKFLGGQEGLAYARARLGNGNFDTDPGGVIRRTPYQLQGLKSFAVATAERATGKPVHPFSNDTKLIDFAGPARTIQSIPFSRVYLNRFPRGYFRDKIVVVGASAPSLQDVHPVAFGQDEMPGPEIQANAIATVLHDLPLSLVPRWINLVLIIVLGLLCPLASLRLNLLWTLMLAIGAAVALLVGTQIAFNHGWVISFVYPLGALVASSVGAIAAHYLLAAFERERVRDVFSRFVPETVVEQVLSRTDRDLRLGGVSLESTVMFTDLRGFTTFSEALPPARVIECLNGYLEEMTDAILGHGGTLVSYEGDGIMAVFGAPIEQTDHADRAVAAAREMLTERLPKWNRWLRENELSDGFKMGIGLNTGMVVSGNVGSERRLEYTAIGDTTNTASRLQGMTKGQSHLLFFSDTTRERLEHDPADLVFIDEFEVRGRQQAVKIWSIEAASDAAFEERKSSGYGALAK